MHSTKIMISGSNSLLAILTTAWKHPVAFMGEHVTMTNATLIDASADMRNVWGSLLVASALAAAFLMARLPSNSDSMRSRVYQPSEQAHMSSSSNAGNTDAAMNKV